MSNEKTGDCYKASCFRLISFLTHNPHGMILVHGWPTLTRPPFEKYSHAWLEYTFNGIRICWDLSMGRDIKVAQADYYSIGKINPLKCIRYTEDEARALVLEHEHWGPWEKL